MSATFDAPTGRLHLTQAGYEALLAFALESPEAPHMPGAHELSDSGMLEVVQRADSLPILQALDALSSPERGRLQLTYDERSADIWVDRVTAVLVLPEEDGLREIRPFQLSLLPLAIARLVDLRPGPVETSPPDPQPASDLPDVIRAWTLAGCDLDGTSRRDGAVDVIDTSRGWYEPAAGTGDVVPVRAHDIALRVARLIGRAATG